MTLETPEDPAAASEAELLARMVQQYRRPELAKAAWHELYLRHRRYVYVVASRAYGSFLGVEGTVDLVVDTFRRAYEWAGRQESAEAAGEEFSGATPDETRRRVLGWLGVIANRLFKDRFRAGAVEGARHEDFLEEWLRGQEASADDSESAALVTLKAALESLLPVEAEVLRASLPWYDLATSSFAVPRGEAAALAAHFGMTPDTFRQRRHRAIKKLQQCLHGAGSARAREEESL